MNEKLKYENAEAVLLGVDPAGDMSDEDKKAIARNPEDWSDEERARVEAIMATLTPPEPEPEVDLRKHFKVGQTFRDPAGMRMVIRTVGKEAMNISTIGGKKGKFVDNHGMTLDGFLFVTFRSKGRNTTLLLRGIRKQVEVPNGEAEAE